MTDHSTHGLGDLEGPFDPDCPCRGTDEQQACADAGCGFCWRVDFDGAWVTGEQVQAVRELTGDGVCEEHEP
jgi:hypothetical protein